MGDKFLDVGKASAGELLLVLNFRQGRVTTLPTVREGLTERVFAQNVLRLAPH